MPGSLLWNNQTQQPEWVRSDEIQSRLSSGVYRTYESSGAVAEGTGQVVAGEELPTFTAAGGTEDPTARGDVGAREAREAQVAAYDNLGDELLTVVDGAVNAATIGLVDGVGDPKDVALRAEANPYARVGGSFLTALASTVVPLGPASALFAGAERVGAGVAARLTGKALETSARAVAARTAGLATQGAIEAGAYAAGSQVANAINGRPVSGEALLDEVGLGAVVGGLIGAPVAALGARAGRRAASVKAAEDAVPALRAVGDGAAVWGQAHQRLEQSYQLYDDLISDGALGEAGEQLLLPRRAAAQDAERARKRLFRAARAKDFGGVAARMDELVQGGRAKDVQEFFGALDAYGAAVSRFDELMRPSTRDADAFGRLSGTAPAPEGFSMARHFEAQGKSFGEGIAASTADDARRLAEEAGVRFAPDQDDVNFAFGSQPGGIYKPKEGAATGAAGPKAKRAAATPDDTRVLANVEVAPGEFKPVRTAKDDLPAGAAVGALGKAKTAVAPVDNASTAVNPVKGTEIRPRHLDVVEFWDKEARRAGFRGSPDLAQDLEAVISRADTASNGRLGSAALKAVAEELGVNLARVQGPLAERGVALWALRRISQSIGSGRGTNMHRLSRRAMEAVGGVAGWGLGGGIVGAALGREVGRIAADRVLGPVSRLVQAQGALRLRAGDSVAKLLTPRRVSRGTFAALATRPLEAAYNPERPQPTRKFEQKAEDLRIAMGNPERVREKIRQNLHEFAMVDPFGAMQAEEVAMTRLRNLHRRIPKFMLPGLLGQPMPPPIDEIAEWELYEAITNDPELAVKLVNAGRIDDTIVEALEEQHPEFRAEMLKAVLENREALERADTATQAAVGRLLGLQLVPEADPMYLQRVQLDYQEQVEERAAKMPVAGSGGMSPNQLPAAIPTPGMVYATPVPNR